MLKNKHTQNKRTDSCRYLIYFYKKWHYIHSKHKIQWKKAFLF